MVTPLTKAVIAGYLLFCVMRLVHLMDLTKGSASYAPLRAEQCTLATGFPTKGFEDIVYIDKTHAIGCAGDLIDVFVNTSFDLARDSRGSHCVLLEYSPGASSSVPLDSDATLLAPGVIAYPLVIEGGNFQVFPPTANDNERPERRALHIHGMDLVNHDAPMLFAVNHAYYLGGESIEVFDVVISERKLRHLRSLRFRSVDEALLYGALNGVSAFDLERRAAKGTGSPQVRGSLFLTKYLEFEDVVQGRVHNGWLYNTWAHAVLYLRAFFGRYNTELILCTFTFDVATELECKVAVNAMFQANGVTTASLPVDNAVNTAPAVTVAVVVDALRHSLVVTTANQAFPVSSDESESVALFHTVDNIVLDPYRPPYCESVPNSETRVSETNCFVTVYGGVIPYIHAASKLNTLDTEGIISPGGIGRFTLRITMSAQQHGKIDRVAMENEEVVVMHNGEFHGTSGGVVFGDGTSGSVAVMGSYKLQGLLTCVLP